MNIKQSIKNKKKLNEQFPAGYQVEIVEEYNGKQLLLFSILSDDRSKASSKTIPPHSAIQSLLYQMRVSSPVLKVIQ